MTTPTQEDRKRSKEIVESCTDHKGGFNREAKWLRLDLENKIATALTKVKEPLEEQVRVYKTIGYSFWRARQALNLPSVTVEDPGQDITNYITKLRAELDSIQAEMDSYATSQVNEALEKVAQMIDAPWNNDSNITGNDVRRFKKPEPGR